MIRLSNNMKFIEKICNLFFLLLVNVVIAGCSKLPAQRYIDLIEKSHNSIKLVSQQEKMLQKNGILVKINKIVDERPHQNNVGIFCGSEIIISDLPAWINNHFVILENVAKSPNNKQEILLDIFIRKLYLQNIGTSKVATIVLKVDYLQKNQKNHVILSKTYRNQLTTVNWNCTENEIAIILNSILNNVKNDVIKDLNSLF